MIIPLLPHSPAEAEGEDDGQHLHGCQDHHHPYHHVHVLIHHVGELVVAAIGEVRVCLCGAYDAGGVFWMK